MISYSSLVSAYALTRRWEDALKVAFCDAEALGIQSPNLRMVSWNPNTLRFGGHWTPQSSAENMTIDAGG